MVDRSGLLLVREALAEDLAGYGDVTSEWTVPAARRGEAEIVTRQEVVVSGLPLATAVIKELDPDVRFGAVVFDGAAVGAGEVVARMQGPVRSILTAERTMLNFLSHLSGVATQARLFATAVEGLPVKVVDTRKTTPGLRVWEKRAVVHGGCYNHRFGLFDMVLIKDNHILAAGGVREAVQRAKRVMPHSLKIEVEVEDVDQLREALSVGVDVVMLDNQSTQSLKKLVGVARSLCPEVLLEASGNVTLKNVRAIAECGVDLVSTSAITMGAPPSDLSLRIHPKE